MASILKRSVPDTVVYVTLTIADTASLSNSTNVALKAAVLGDPSNGDLPGYVPFAIWTPAGIEGSLFTFQQSYDPTDTNLANLYYSPTGDGTGSLTELQVLMSASKAISLAAHVQKFMGGRNWKVRTGTSGSPTAQTGAASLVVALRVLP